MLDAKPWYEMLEMRATNAPSEAAQISIAISLKRIADLMEAHEKRVVDFYATKENPQF